MYSDPALARRTRARITAVALLVTFVVVRTALHLSPNRDFDVGGYNIHHLFTGLLILVACAIPLTLDGRDSRATRFLAAGFGVGLSLTLDEWSYLILTDGSNAAYLLPESWIGGAVLNVLAALYILGIASRR